MPCKQLIFIGRNFGRLSSVFFVLALIFCFSAAHADIAAQSYVDNLNANVQDNYVTTINLANAIAAAIAAKADTASLAPVATSGSFNDLTDKPVIPAAQVQSDWNQTNTASLDYIKNKPTVGMNGNGVAVGTIGQVVSNSITGAATNAVFWVEMDGYTFKATKQSAANYWAVRLVNNTGAPVTIGSSWLQLYGATQSINKESVNLAVGVEFNPDAEAGDLGYGKEDTAIVHIFDTTNMHLYRWTTTVYVGNAVIAVEKLY